MKLDPATYTCPDHQTDLTSQVQDALDDDDSSPVAYYRTFLGNASGPRSFEVIVMCPGAVGASSHQLTCTGTYTR